MELTKNLESKHHAAQGTLGRMDNYYRWILGNFGDNVGRRVWDAGAGVGHVTELLSRRADFVLATEFTDRNLEALRERFAGRDAVRVEFCDLRRPESLDLAQHELDTIVTLDVLEHLEDDRAALSRYHEILQPGGAFLIKVPAHPFLFGSVDEASLHYRRYRKRELREKLAGAGFRVVKLRHMNLLATVPYFLKGRVLKRTDNFSSTLDPDRVGFYNRLMPWFERIERVLPVPFGLSLVAVGRKPSLVANLGSSGHPLPSR
jgi:2-polyprenyl-3-methyl-5-hydroxy-6-metoxy-1,4-benzoquinol methylase